MFLEIINKIVSFFNDIFEELNEDEYPKNYIEIINEKGKKEEIYYG